MPDCSWISLVAMLLVFSFPGISGRNASSCDEIIPLTCPPPLHIVLINITATTNLASRIIKDCSALEECLVKNPYRECVQLEYGCRQNKENTVKIEESSNFEMDGDFSMFSLMSDGYEKGHYIKAQKLTCALTPAEKDNNTAVEMQVTFNEFSPFANSPDFCFHENDAPKPLICSGMGTFQQSYGPFEIDNGWVFSMALNRSAIDIPRIRYWITFDVSPNNRSRCHLECHSDPASADANRLCPFVITISFTGGMLSTLILAGICWLKRSKKKQVGSSEDTYCDVDVNNLDVCRQLPECGNRPRIILSETNPVQNTNHVSNGSITMKNMEDQDIELSDTEIIDNDIYGSHISLNILVGNCSCDVKIYDNPIYESEITVQVNAENHEVDNYDKVIFG